MTEERPIDVGQGASILCGSSLSYKLVSAFANNPHLAICTLPPISMIDRLASSLEFHWV
jgi:hypothetical protein